VVRRNHEADGAKVIPQRVAVVPRTATDAAAIVPAALREPVTETPTPLTTLLQLPGLKTVARSVSTVTPPTFWRGEADAVAGEEAVVALYAPYLKARHHGRRR
jgi:hypothetical protein